MFMRLPVIVAAVSCVLLAAVRVEANAITINNLIDTQGVFLTRVTGSVGFFPPFHLLVDIPGTPWDSSSTIAELPNEGLPFVPDVITIRWNIQHLVGPDATDINPNPNEPVTLTLGFIASAPGPFGGTFDCIGTGVYTTLTVAHPLTTGGTHFDDLCLDIKGTVTTGPLGSLDISSFSIDYLAEHCDVLDPVAFGCAIPGGGGNPVPEPSGLVLFGSGVPLLVAAIARRRWRRRTSPRSIAAITRAE
jgi:hypothetical protein